MPADGPDPRDDERAPGERPGLNDSPLGPAFRDGPRRSPVATRSLLLGLLPVVVVGLVLVALLV